MTDASSLPLPFIEDNAELLVDLGGEVNHTVEVGEHIVGLLVIDQIGSLQLLFDFVPEGHQIVMVIFLCHHQLLQTVVSVFGFARHLLPLLQGRTYPQDELEVLGDREGSVRDRQRGPVIHLK